MINRSVPPAIKPVDDIDFYTPHIHELTNGLELYTINMGEQDITRIDIMFASGKWDQPKNLCASLTNLLLKEGTPNYSSRQIAEHMDFYGAWIQNSVSRHNSYFTLYALNKHLDKLLPMLEEIIKAPTFPEEIFNTQLARRRQQFKIDQQKVDALAISGSMKQLFGENHPYGKQLSETDFDTITASDLKEFHKNHYHSDNCKIVITGKISDKHIPLFNTCFGSKQWGNSVILPEIKAQISPGPKFEKIIKEDSAQSAVRISARTINRDNADFNNLRILNTILGGYFGSRLMLSIREEKGYTYGIGSSISAQKQGSYLTIGTQTATQNVEALTEAVFEEIKQLKNKLISTDELNRVKSYMLGDFTRSFDGPFATADAQISLLANELPETYFKNQIESIHRITPDILLNIANKYLIDEDFHITVAGQ